MRKTSFLLLSLALILALAGCSVPPPRNEPVDPGAQTAPAMEQAQSAPAEIAAPVVSAAPAISAQPPLIPATPKPDLSGVPLLESGFYDSFFNNSVFIGDSITQGMQNYLIQFRQKTPLLLGNAKVIAAKSFTLVEACAPVAPEGDAALRFQGRSMSLPELLKATKAEKLFIMLGANDYGGGNLEESVAQYRVLLDFVMQNAPDVAVYVQSCTPMVKGSESEARSNAQLDAFNAALFALCEEKGVHYVDVATPMKDASNGLMPEYSSDQYMHMSEAGAQKWIDALYTYAQESYALGQWKAE